MIKNIVCFGLQFNKDGEKSIEDMKLRVVYISPMSPQGSTEDDTVKNSTQKLDANSVSFSHSPSIWGNQFEVLFLSILSNLVILCV